MENLFISREEAYRLICTSARSRGMRNATAARRWLKEGAATYVILNTNEVIGRDWEGRFYVQPMEEIQ